MFNWLMIQERLIDKLGSTNNFIAIVEELTWTNLKKPCNLRIKTEFNMGSQNHVIQNRKEGGMSAISL